MSTPPAESSAPPSLSNRPRLPPPYAPDSVTAIASQPFPEAANSDGDGDSHTAANSMDTATAAAVAADHRPIGSDVQATSSPSPQENNYSTSNYADDVKPSSSVTVTDPAQEGGVVAAKYPHPASNETFSPILNVAEPSWPRFCTTRVGCDGNKEDCFEVAAHGGERMNLGASGESSQAGRTSSAIMGTGCKEDVQTLMEDVGLLNNLFYSFAASASSKSREEDARSQNQNDDAQSNISPDRCQDSNSIMEMEDRSNKLEMGSEEITKSLAGYQSPLPPISITEAADSVLATAMMLITDNPVTSLTTLENFKGVNDVTGTTSHAMKSNPLASIAKSLDGYQSPLPPISISTDDAAGSVATSRTTLEYYKDVNDITGTTGHAMISASPCEKNALTELTQAAVDVTPVPAHSSSRLVPSAGSIRQEAARSTATANPSSPLDLLSSVSATSPCLDMTPSSSIGPARELATKAIGKKATGPNLAILAAEKRWSENLASVRPCIEPGGYINYVTIDDKGTRTRVHNFVKEQRKSYQKREKGESTNMTDERLKLLEEAKFPFVFRPYPNTSKLVTPLAGDQAVIDPEDSAMRPISTSDLLCSITAQSFKETGLCDDAIDNKDSQENRPTAPPAHLAPATSGFGSARLVDQRTRSPNCRQFVACVRDDCGECKACRDNQKFSGINKSRQRGFNRHCVSRKKEKRPPQKKKTAVSSKRSEVAMMKSELAKIKAELGTKSRGWEVNRKLLKEVEQSDDDETMFESGFVDGQEDAFLGRTPGYTEKKSSRPVENSLKEAKKIDDEDAVMDTAESFAHKSTHDLCNAVYATAMATLMAAGNTTPDLSRGVMVRPSGKWQVQLYYAGSSRYIGMFDTRKEATMAYDMARKCCDSFKKENPALEQVERNLNLMREAAFSVVERKPSNLEESKQNYQPKERSVVIQQDKVEKSTAVSGTCAGGDDVAMEAGLADVNDGSDATAQGETKPLGLVKKSKKAKRKVEVTSTDEVKEDSDTRKRKFSHETYQKAKASADTLSRGITVRPSGKWQVQLFYAGKSRYIGVFDSKLDAAAAYKLARGCFVSFKDGDPSPQQAKKNVELMRKAAFSFTRNNSKRHKTSVNNRLVVACCDRLNKRDSAAETALLTQKPCAKKHDPKKSTGESISETSFKTRVELGIKSSHEKKEGPTKVGEKKKIKTLSLIKQAATPTAIAMVVAERKRAKRTSTAVTRTPTSAEKKKAKQVLQIKQAAPIVAPVAVGESTRTKRASTAKKASLAKSENIKRKQEEYIEAIQHNDLCECCGGAGDLLCCSTCNLVFHLGCTRPKLNKLPEDDWSCAFCVSSGGVIKKANRQEQRKARVAVREIEALKAGAIKKEKSRRKSPRERKIRG